LPFCLISQNQIKLEIKDFHFHYCPPEKENHWVLKSPPPAILIPSINLPSSFFFVIHSAVKTSHLKKKEPDREGFDSDFYISGPYLALPINHFQFTDDEHIRMVADLQKNFLVLCLIPRFRRRIHLKESENLKSLSGSDLTKIKPKDARQFLELLKLTNGLDKASYNYHLDFIYPILRLSRHEKFTYFIDEEVDEKPGVEAAYNDLFYFLQESEIIGSLDTDKLHFKLSFLLDRYLDHDSKIKKLLIEIGDLSLSLKKRYDHFSGKNSNFFPHIHLLFTSCHEGAFPIELFPLADEFLGLVLPVLRKKKIASNKFQAPPGHSRLNSSQRLFIFCNPEGEKLEFSEYEADTVFTRASRTGLFSKIQLVKCPLSASEFYQYLQSASVFYYIGHGSIGSYGPQIDLKNGTLALSAVHSLKKFPAILFFSACNPMQNLGKNSIRIIENPDFPSFQSIYPMIKLKDRRNSFCLRVFSELLDGKNLAQSILTSRKFFFCQKDPSWANWRIEGWPYFKFQRLKHYTFYI
jgi:hypothetical protein